MEMEGQQKSMIRSEISGKTLQGVKFEWGGRGKREDITHRLMQQSECQEEKLLFLCFFSLCQNQRHS